MHTGGEADFISLRGTDQNESRSKPRRGLTSSRGHYGPPKGPVTSAHPRNIVTSNPSQPQDPVRTKRKRDATLDRKHLIRMPWHAKEPYFDGIVG